MNEIVVTITGNVTDTPRRGTTKSGDPFVFFRLASTVRRRVAGTPGQYENGETTFVNVSAFRALAVNIDSSITKGDPVVVQGRLKVTSWSRDERSGISVDVEAYHVGHDLARGRTEFTKVSGHSGFSDGGRMTDGNVQDVREEFAAMGQFIDPDTGEIVSVPDDAEPGDRFAPTADRADDPAPFSRPLGEAIPA